MINRYIVAAAFLIIAVFASYFINFSILLGYSVSDDSAIWSNLGGYVGGMLGPLLSFISIVLLIKSLTLQNEANSSLRTELMNNAKTEKLRSFETLFFNMINSQKTLFESFRIQLGADQLVGVKAVIAIEDEIQKVREGGGTDDQIQKYLDSIDNNDQIFGLSRAFYIIVMIVTDKLSDAEDFTLDDRKEHFQTLVNFTDFAQLRLVMICVQFMDFHSAKYISSSSEFRAVIEELELNYELY